MARKRKIPVRKHHGIRDPLKQLEEREKKLKNVINNPPDKENDQKLSYKFQQFKKLADAAQAGKKKLSKLKFRAGVEDLPKKNTKQPAQEKTKKFKPIKQMPGEEDVDYLRRVNRITRESLNEAKYEMKYGVTVTRNDKTGEICVKKKTPNEIDELLKLKRRNSKKNNKRHKEVKGNNLSPKDKMDPQMIKELVKQAIKEEKEAKRLENNERLEEYKRDVIPFGEVVHGPPSFLTLPRKAEKHETVPRPGRKNNLLLKELLCSKEDASSKSSSSTNKVKPTTDGRVIKNQLKGKRKHLPFATRNMLETEQKKMVTLYRELKQSRQQQQQ